MITGGGSVSIAERRYLFVDVGYLAHRYRAAMEKFLGVAGSLDVSNLGQNFGCYRTYIYDCIDLRRKTNETDGEYNARVKGEESRIALVDSLPGFHVRLGKITGSKATRQKQVDILLAVDMLEQAGLGNFGRVELLAGDSDFVPLVEAVVRMGKWVEVIFDPDSIADDLLRAADSRLQIGWNNYQQWTHASYALPELPSLGSQLVSDPAESYGYRQIRTGRIGGSPVKLFKGNELFLVERKTPRMQGMHKDEELLTRYFAAHFGNIEWSSGATP